MHQGNEAEFAAHIARFKADYPQYFIDTIDRLFFKDFAADWFAALPEAIQFLALKYYLNSNRWYLNDVTLQYQLLEQLFGAAKPADPEIVHTVVEQRLLRGKVSDAEEWIINDLSADGLKLLATLRFLQNRYDEALELFNAALKAAKKAINKRNISYQRLARLFFQPVFITYTFGGQSLDIKTAIGDNP